MSDRATLISFFEDGDFPTEAQFTDLINSMVNIQDDNPPITLSTTISTGQAKNLFTQEIEIVPAQGANAIARVVAITAKVIFNTTAYTVPGFSRLEIHETNLAGALVSNFQGSFLTVVADSVEQPTPSIPYLVIKEDTALVAAYTVGNPTLGDSPIEIKALVQRIQF